MVKLIGAKWRHSRLPTLMSM